MTEEALIMIEDLQNVKLNPEEVFQISIHDDELVQAVRDMGWSQASKENLEQCRGEHGFRSDLYLYYALYWGQEEGLEDVDLYSFAGLMTSLIPGLGASFGTDTYEKERIIENKALDIYNAMAVAGVEPLKMAKTMVQFCLDEYKKPARPRMLAKNWTLREDQVKRVNKLWEDEKLDNKSQALRKIVDLGLKELNKGG